MSEVSRREGVGTDGIVGLSFCRILSCFCFYIPISHQAIIAPAVCSSFLLLSFFSIILALLLYFPLRWLSLLCFATLGSYCLVATLLCWVWFGLACTISR